MKLKHHTVSIGGRNFSYWENNSSRKEVVVLLHGFPGNHLGLVDLARYLGDNKRILLPDLPACGQSESLAGVHHLETYAAWLEDFLAALFVDKAVVVGHSFGARVAVVFARRCSQKTDKLILITPVLGSVGFIARIVTLYYKIAESLPFQIEHAMTRSNLAKKIINGILFKSPDLALREIITNRDIAELKRLDPWVVGELFQEFHASEPLVLVKNITLLVIAGDQDIIVTVKSIKDFMGPQKHIALHIVKNAGHFLPLEQPQETAAIINNFLITSL